MTTTGNHKLLSAGAYGLLALVLSACGPRVLISTGTTLGLKATPGDGQTRPPQVTLGYKRAETALVPTNGEKATSVADKECKGTSDIDTRKRGKICDTDAFSTVAAIHFNTRFFGPTELKSFIGTGIAARDIIQDNREFKTAFAATALDPDVLAERRLDAVDDIAESIMKDNVTDASELKAFFICAGKKDAIATNLAIRYSNKTKEEFMAAFKKDYSAAAPGYRDKCVN